MNNFQKVFKNTFFLILSEFFLKIIGFLWIIFLARSLSVFEYGRYTLVNSFLTIFSFLPDLGIGLIVIREIAKNPKKADVYLGASLVLNFLLSFLMFTLVFLAVAILGYEYELRILIVISSFSLFLSTLRSIALMYFEGTERMEITALITSVNSLLVVVFAFLGFWLNFQLKGIFFGVLLGNLASMYLAWAFFLKKFCWPKFFPDGKLLKFFLTEGLPLGLASFFALIYTNIDSIILGKILGEEQVGIYNSATPFVFSLIQLINVPFMMAVYPALSRLYILKDKKRFNLSFKKSLLLIGLWSIPTAVIVHFLSPVIIPLAFSQKYLRGIPVLQILIFFVPFASLSALLYKVLMVIGRQKIYLLISLAGALINIILNLIFVPKLQVFGAAYASVITQIMLFGIYLVVVLRLIKK